MEIMLESKWNDNKKNAVFWHNMLNCIEYRKTKERLNGSINKIQFGNKEITHIAQNYSAKNIDC